jgi:hypothetical protein
MQVVERSQYGVADVKCLFCAQWRHTGKQANERHLAACMRFFRLKTCLTSTSQLEFDLLCYRTMALLDAPSLNKVTAYTVFKT